MSRNIHMPQHRYVLALKRIRGLIANGLKLKSCDSDTTGDKHTECSWGLCSDQRAAWPFAEDHLWPDLFTKEGRIAPLYLEQHQKCPLDRRPTNNKDMNGCFYTCMHFNRKKGEPKLNQEAVIKLYDARIAEHDKEKQ